MRHAEGCHNADDADSAGHKGTTVGGGWRDPPLTRIGRTQAEGAKAAITQIFANTAIAAVLVSPMRRAQQTALLGMEDVLTAHPDLRLYVAPHIDERVSSSVLQVGANMLGGQVENLPMPVNMQACLWYSTRALGASRDWTHGYPHFNRINQCPAFNWHAFRAQLELANLEQRAPVVDGHAAEFPAMCQWSGDRKQLYYSSNVDRAGTTAFATWAHANFKGKSIFVAGHSNWAKRAGIMQVTHGTTEEKVQWASITDVLIKAPGSKPLFEKQQTVHPGSAKAAGHTESAAGDPTCAGDILHKTACKQAGHDYGGRSIHFDQVISHQTMRQGNPWLDSDFDRLDKNGDGLLSFEEWMGK